MKFKKGARNMILEQSRSGVYNRSAQFAVAGFSRGSVAGFSRGSVALTQVRHNLQCPGAETQPERSLASQRETSSVKMGSHC